MLSVDGDRPHRIRLILVHREENVVSICPGESALWDQPCGQRSAARDLSGRQIPDREGDASTARPKPCEPTPPSLALGTVNPVTLDSEVQ